MAEILKFDQYLGMGDSLTGDYYPGKNRGANSLLYSNTSDTPEFDGLDLKTANSECGFYNLTVDGNTSSNLLGLLKSDLPQCKCGNSLITLSIGGNDVIHSILSGESNYDFMLNQTSDNISQIIYELKDIYPTSDIVLATVYDPTPHVKDLSLISNTSYQDIIQSLNDRLLEFKRLDIQIADVFSHFKKNSDSSWYIFPYEPSQIGGSEIRRVFLQTLLGKIIE